MIPLNAYPIIRRGKEIRLKFISRYSRSKLQKVIDLFESKNKKIIRKNDLIEEMRDIMSEEHDLRVINLLFYSLMVFYDLHEEKRPFIIGGKSRVLIRDEWDLKRIFYMWVQKKYGGFIPLEDREIAINKFCEEYRIDKEKLDNILAGGILRGYKLVRRTQNVPKVEEVIGISNFLLLEKTLGISSYATVIFYNVERKGAFVKDLLYRSKRARLLLDFRFENNDLVCDVSGPFQIFKHPSPIYGEGISRVLVGSLCKHKNWRLRVGLQYRKRNYFFNISSSDQKIKHLIPPWKYRHGQDIKQFDSETEMRLWNILKRLFPEFNIAREVDILEGVDGTIFIPDFTLRKDKKEVYIELVGFWTEKYARKKREKLDKIYISGIKSIIAVVDKKLKNFFGNTRYPVIYYDKRFIFAKSLKKAVCDLMSLN
ncbi:MAG: DUF790 family protein [Candidatus Njordarchaeota archaeon]